MRPALPIAVLAAAVLTAAAFDVAAAARVVVFDNESFVDTTSGGIAAESDNVQATLADLGHDVSTTESTLGSALNLALAAADVLVIPELEVEDLSAVLDPLARAVLSQFVAKGGGLIIHGTTDERATALLNSVFGWTLTAGVTGSADLQPATSATAFEGGPAFLPDNDRTRGLDVGSLPSDALVAYLNESRAPVVRLSHGGGRVAYLGWDWYAATPLGPQDGGWVEVLDRTVADLTACSPLPGAVDDDGDGIPDACDRYAGCADPDGLRSLGKGSRVVLKRLQDDGGADALAVAAHAYLPEGSTFGNLDPRVLAFRVVLRAADGTVSIAEGLPAVPYDRASRVGWRFKPRAKRWVFRDRTGFLTNGIREVSLKDLSRTAKGRVRVIVAGKAGSYPLGLADAPVSLFLALGDESIGECAESAFTIDECRPSATRERIKCKL
jgi:hypothetical protein